MLRFLQQNKLLLICTVCLQSGVAKKGYEYEHVVTLLTEWILIQAYTGLQLPAHRATQVSVRLKKKNTFNWSWNCLHLSHHVVKNLCFEQLRADLGIFWIWSLQLLSVQSSQHWSSYIPPYFNMRNSTVLLKFSMYLRNIGRHLGTRKIEICISFFIQKNAYLQCHI